MEISPALTEFFEYIWNNILGIIGIIGLFIEITPIKFNPISWLIGKINEPTKKLISEKLTEVNVKIENVNTSLKDDIAEITKKQENTQNDIGKIVEEMDMQEIRHIRWEILDFGNAIENGQLHSRDQYRHIDEDAKKYHDLIKRYGLTNGLIDEEHKKIKKHYEDNKNSTAYYI